MGYAGLDLSRKRLDVHLLAENGETVEVTQALPPTVTVCGAWRSAWTVTASRSARRSSP